MSRDLFQQTYLPLVLAGISLLLLNLGLYGLLASNPREPLFALPYIETFAELPSAPYQSFGGDWEVRDESLVQINTVGLDLGTIIPINIAPDEPYRYEVDVRHVGGGIGGGLIFNLQNSNNRQQSHMARFNVDDDGLFLIYGFFGDDSDFQGQGNVPLGSPSESFRLGVQVYETTYDLTLDEEVVAEAIPLNYQGGSVGLITSASQVVFDNLLVEPLDIAPVEQVGDGVITEPSDTSLEDPVAAASSIYADYFDVAGGADSPWVPFTGEWEFADGALRQTLRTGFDYGIGNVTPFDTYRFVATIRHEQGQGGGLYFGMAEPNSKSNAHMVRYVHDEDFLTWGYFDADNQYIGQGSAPVDAPGTAVHTLEVLVFDDVYRLMLDGEVLTGDVPLVQDGPHIGLVAAESVVAFESVNITAPGELPAIVDEPVGNDVAETGTWDVIDTGLVQVEEKEFDFVTGTGFAGETFRLSVDISMSAGTGGGFVFHTAGRDTPAGGHMVRFDSANDQIFWGTYDGDRKFTGTGSIAYAIDADTSYALEVEVGPSTFDIFVDDETIVTGIPLQRDSGWIGLVSFSGPITFEDFVLTQ